MRDLKKIDQYTQAVESACMLLNKTLDLDFLECLIRVGKDITTSTDEAGLEPSIIRRLNSIYHGIRKQTILNEEVRLAMEILIVKAFKHRLRYPTSLMTPDAINYLFAYLVGKLSLPNHTIIDMVLGTGNLLTAISNYIAHPLHLIGIEKDETLVRLAQVNADLQGASIKIYLNDCLDPILEQGQIIIGDLDSNKGQHYFPYQVILRSLDLLEETGFFIFLIDNDFFNQPQKATFQEQFMGTLCGIIVLPDTLFQDNVVGKSILVGCKKALPNYDMMILNLPGINDTDRLNKTIDQLDQWMTQLKGLIL